MKMRRLFAAVISFTAIFIITGLAGCSQQNPPPLESPSPVKTASPAEKDAPAIESSGPCLLRMLFGDISDACHRGVLLAESPNTGQTYQVCSKVIGEVNNFFISWDDTETSQENTVLIKGKQAWFISFKPRSIKKIADITSLKIGNFSLAELLSTPLPDTVKDNRYIRDTNSLYITDIEPCALFDKVFDPANYEKHKKTLKEAIRNIFN